MSAIKKFYVWDHEVLGRVNIDLEELFLYNRQSYRYYNFFFKKNTSFINSWLLKYKDDIYSVFKNYRTLQENQSGCKLKILQIYKEEKYIREFDEYLREIDISHEVIAF